MTVEDWHKVLGVNLCGAFFLSKRRSSTCSSAASGRIINISSVIGQTGNIGQANYAASKSGLFGLTMTLAKEAAFALGKADKLTDEGPGLTVNTVAPGYIATEMVEAVPEKVLDKIRAQIPMARLGQARGDRPHRGLPGRRRVELHHRAGVRRQRRHGHVAAPGTGGWVAVAHHVFARRGSGRGASGRARRAHAPRSPYADGVEVRLGHLGHVLERTGEAQADVAQSRPGERGGAARAVERGPHAGRAAGHASTSTSVSGTSANATSPARPA